MGKYDGCISFPISANIKKSLFVAATYIIGGLLMGLYFTGGLTPAMRADPSNMIVIWFISGFVCCGMGLLYLGEVLLRVRLAKNEIVVTLFGIPVRRYSAEKLGMLCITRWKAGRRGGQQWKEYLGACFFTPEAAADARETQLSRNWFTKTGIPFRKRNANWQKKFIAEYIKRRARLEHLFPLRRDVLWCQWDGLRFYHFTDAYGQIAWVDLTKE